VQLEYATAVVRVSKHVIKIAVNVFNLNRGGFHFPFYLMSLKMLTEGS